MTENEPQNVGVTHRARLAARLRDAGRGNEARDDARRQEMIQLADALQRGERIEAGSWIFDYMEDLPLTGEQYSGLNELVTVNPDGSVLLKTSRADDSQA